MQQTGGRLFTSGGRQVSANQFIRGKGWKRVTDFVETSPEAMAGMPVGTVLRVKLGGVDSLSITIRKEPDHYWQVFTRTNVNADAFAGMRVARCVVRGGTGAGR